MATNTTSVEILDINQNLVCVIKSLMPFDNNGTILQYSRELSNYGTCRFRISAYDTVLTTFGDIINPHKYHVRIKRGDYVVWKGAIIDNPKRTKQYIDILAAEYLYYLDRKLIHRTSSDVNGTANIYRIFKSGTLSDAITAIMNETITDYSTSNHVLKTMTIGTIENPNFPPNMVSGVDNTALTGAWVFGDGTSTNKGPTVQFDFHTVLYALKALGIYSYCDFEITQDMKFNFYKFLGRNMSNSLTFKYGTQGNIIDYNLPRFGKRQSNDVWAIATNTNGVIIHSEVQDQSSIAEYGYMESVAAYSDVMSEPQLKARISAELPYVSTPDETNAIIYLNEQSYPLGQYTLGDIVAIEVKNNGVNFSGKRRIVGYTVILNETGRERVAIQTNVPQDWQFNS